MSQYPLPDPEALQQEAMRLRAELALKDRLVEQLSLELLALVKEKESAPPAAETTAARSLPPASDYATELERQVLAYQEQLYLRDGEIEQWQQVARELTERNAQLERVVEELPEIYHQKFAERMHPVKEKIVELQRENRQLHAKLQSASYRLAVRDRDLDPGNRVDLPDFTHSRSRSNSPYENV